jgi:hypothetical protein
MPLKIVVLVRHPGGMTVAIRHIASRVTVVVLLVPLDIRVGVLGIEEQPEADGPGFGANQRREGFEGVRQRQVLREPVLNVVTELAQHFITVAVGAVAPAGGVVVEVQKQGPAPACVQVGARVFRVARQRNELGLET